MRSAVAFALLSASVAFAQQGVWTGYVGGWQSTPTPVAVHPLALTYQTPAYRQLEFLARNAYGYGYVAPGYFPQQQDTAQQEAMAAQAARFAAQQEQAARQRQFEREQALAAEAQLLAQQQQLALQQQLLAQQQQQALVEELARIAEREAQLRRVEAEQKALAEQEAERLRAARPREKGPDIHRWVDEEGVVHYSTKPRP